MRLLPLIAVLIIAGFNSCTHPAPTAALNVNDTLLYIMAGQSNMCGRGAISQDDTATDERILGMDATNHFARKLEPDITQQPSPSAGLDCGMSFGRTMISVSSSSLQSVGLIPCAVSSTGIREWLGDSLHAVHLYSNMLSRARAGALTGRLAGVLWHQGETDADDSLICRGYAQSLQAFILKFRNDVGNPHLPFFIGKLARWCNKPYKDSVNAGITATGAALQDVYIISADDLTGKSDSLHFDAAGQRELGRRYATQALMHL